MLTCVEVEADVLAETEADRDALVLIDAFTSVTVALETAEVLSILLSESSVTLAVTLVVVLSTVPEGRFTDQVPSVPTGAVAVVTTPSVVKVTVTIVPASAVPVTVVLVVVILSVITGAFGVTLSISKVSVKSRRFGAWCGKVLDGVT